MTAGGYVAVAAAAPSPAAPAPAASTVDVHLVVLQHGLWGNASNLTVLEAVLHRYVESLSKSKVQQQQQQQGGAKEGRVEVELQDSVVRTLNSFVNEDKLTYDGVDMCGDRLVELIKETARNLEQEQGLKVKRLSFIGYSLGGLICRYAVGKLEHEGAFTQGASGGWQPTNFVTVATPHLGAWRKPPPSCFRRTYNDVYHRMVPVISSTTGYQLMLKDTRANGQPLLLNMSDPSLIFFQGLRRFSKLMVLSNTHADQMVPYRTAAICMEEVYEGKSTAPALDPLAFPSVVQPAELGSAARPPTAFPWFLPLILLLLSPLLLPLMLVLLLLSTVRGLRHYRSQQKQRSQSQSAWGWDTQPAGPGGTGGVVAAVQVDMLSSTPHAGAGAGAGAGVVSAGVVLEEKQAAASSGPAAARPSMLEMQERMVAQLNRLPWQRVDVDTRHTHAHAAIVLRPKTPSQMLRKFEAKDHLDFMLSQMEW